MTDIKVFENLLDRQEFLEIQSIFFSNNFPWFYHDNISGLNEPRLGDYGFGHVIYYEEPKSTIYPTLESLINLILTKSDTTKLLKARADMTVYSTYGHQHQPHLDLHQPHVVSIFYLSNSDAETIIFKDGLNEYQRIQPKENKLLIFNGKHYHTGHSPASSNRRILLNINSI